MAHLLAAFEEPRKPTAAMELGRVVHAACLEPDQFDRRFVVMPPFEEEIRRPDGSEYASPKATRKYKDLVVEFIEDHEGQQIISADAWRIASGIRDSIAAHNLAHRWIAAEGATEVSLVWRARITGLRCKARIDKLLQPALDGVAVVDLKTTTDASHAELQIAALGYHRQMAMYVEGVRVLYGAHVRAGLIFAETSPPWAVRAAPLSDDALQWGRARIETLLREYKKCLDLPRDQGPGYEDPEQWNLPAWATADALHEGPVGLVTDEETARV